MDSKAWCAAVYGVAKSRTKLSDWTEMLLYTVCPLTLIYNYCFINRIEKRELKAKNIVILAFIFTYTITFTYVCLFFLCFKLLSAAAAAKSLQSCPTLCDPMDCSLPGFSVHGVLQARTLEWVAISFSNAWKWKVKVKSLSCVRLLATPWTAAYQAPPSMGFSRQQYWSGVPLPSPKLLSSAL